MLSRNFRKLKQSIKRKQKRIKHLYKETNDSSLLKSIDSLEQQLLSLESSYFN